MNQRTIRIPALLACAVACFASTAVAGDWPQILGPDRNNFARDEKLADSWPTAGPKLVWQRAVGEGFAGVAVASGKTLVFHRTGEHETLEALDAATGKPLWKQEFPASYQGGIAPDNGPRCVPLVAGDTVYALGAAGALHAVALADGAVRWNRDLCKDYAAPEGYFGAGSTPIAADGKLLVNVGGKGAGIVALDLATGKTLWKATDEQASYSSPIQSSLTGAAHVVFITRLKLLGIDPASGKVLYETPFGQRGPTVNGASPLEIDGRLFVTASYGIGAQWLKPSDSGCTVEWASDEVLSSQYPTPVAVNGLVYGFDGRDDVGVASLRCIDPKTQKIRWNQNGFGLGALLAADGKLLIQKTDGALVLAQATPEKYVELARFQAFDTTSRALPALAGGKLYVRDTKTLKCFAVGK